MLTLPNVFSIQHQRASAQQHATVLLRIPVDASGPTVRQYQVGLLRMLQADIILSDYATNLGVGSSTCCDQVEPPDRFLRKFERRSLQIFAKVFDRRCAGN